MTKIKNCGLKKLSELEAAAKSGASYVGLVHHAASPRHLPLERIKSLETQKPIALKSVIVTINPDDALLDAIAEIRPDFLQVHKVDVARAATIAERTRLPLIIAVSITRAEDIVHARRLEPLAAHMLLDAKEAGSGKPFDWNLLVEVNFSKPWFLAGGLNASNVAEALRITAAPMVDVSSGLEDAPGIKSLEKIAAFNAAVLNAAHG